MGSNDEMKKGEGEDNGRAEDKVFLPALDLSTLILPFYTQALIKLGLIDDPLTGQAEPQLELAKRMIDLLELFQSKTQGNLSPQEQTFLESMLTQLRLHYLEKAKIIKV